MTPQIKDVRLFKILETISMHLTNNCMHAPDTVASSDPYLSLNRVTRLPVSWARKLETQVRQKILKIWYSEQILTTI